MRIAQIAPLAERVPPKLYGGTERVVAWLVEELVELGHKITLFASGDSQTKADLVPVCPRALRLGKPRPRSGGCTGGPARSGGKKSRRIRRHPRSHRLASPAHFEPLWSSVPNDVTWPARSSRSVRDDPAFSDRSIRFYF